MELIEYLGYVLLYGYLVFGLFYIANKVLSISSNQYFRVKPRISSIGVLNKPDKALLDEIFIELGIKSIE